MEFVFVYVSIAIGLISVANAEFDDGNDDFWRMYYKNTNTGDKNKQLKLFGSDVEDDDDPRLEKNTCWINLDIKNLFTRWRKLDNEYESVRKTYNEGVATAEFDVKMLKDFVVTNAGRALRALHNFNDNTDLIPAGLNLGGYSMMKMPDSMLFFYRMKLRNDTQFTVNNLHTNLYNMTLEAGLLLNDLHLVGEYERVKAKHGSKYENNTLIYHPTFGKVEVLLQKAQFHSIGRYRMLKDYLYLDAMKTKLTSKNILLYFHNSEGETQPDKDVKTKLGDFLTRLKLDLEHWLKDYINDYLSYLPLKDHNNLKDKFVKYDQEKGLLLSDYVDKAVEGFKKRLRLLRARALRLPVYVIYTTTGMKIKLTRGVLRGLESMHRVSVATGSLHTGSIDGIIGFSKLKVEYRYEASIMPGVPPIFGTFIMNADHTEAKLALFLLEQPESFGIRILIHKRANPEDLTVEGALNRRISNFKHILQTQIFTIMSQMVYMNMIVLTRIATCNPAPPIPGFNDTNEVFSNEIKKKSDLDNGQNKNSDDEAEQKSAFAVDREDSAEIILPPEDGETVGKTLKLKYEEHFYVKEPAK